MSLYTHIVLRPFEAGGDTMDVGQAVDASEWKNTERMVNTKYLRPINDADLARLKKLKSSKSTKSAAPKKRFFKKVR